MWLLVVWMGNFETVWFDCALFAASYCGQIKMAQLWQGIPWNKSSAEGQICRQKLLWVQYAAPSMSFKALTYFRTVLPRSTHLNHLICAHRTLRILIQVSEICRHDHFGSLICSPLKSSHGCTEEKIYKLSEIWIPYYLGKWRQHKDAQCRSSSSMQQPNLCTIVKSGLRQDMQS